MAAVVAPLVISDLTGPKEQSVIRKTAKKAGSTGSALLVAVCVCCGLYVCIIAVVIVVVVFLTVIK